MEWAKDKREEKPCGELGKEMRRMNGPKTREKRSGMATYCVIVCTVGRIIVENHGWCYASCMKCNKSVVLEMDHSNVHVANTMNEVQPKYKNSSVNKISYDPELMQAIMDLRPDVEQSLSGIASHNPEVTMATTPTKKVVDEVPNHDSQARMPITPTKRSSVEECYEMVDVML
ncbi:hypothetical protein JHK87_049873 [Glycine soja]|nr:hypothetical protein JHK87_049873 [Glycine soja]